MNKFTLIVLISLYSVLLNASSLRVTSDNIVQNNKNYILLDTREALFYKQGHIKNAINFPVSLTYERALVDGKLTNPFTMQKIIQNLGLREDDTLVIYDEGSFFDAARLFWALEVYGFKHVKLLDSGYVHWKEKGYPTSNISPKVKKSNYITIIDNNRLATKFATQIATKNPNHIIIDARPTEAYLGKVSAAKRYGHIPKAKNIPATHNINTTATTQTLKDIDTLKTLYQDIDKNKKIILYCAIGKISATNYFALRELGYNVSNYDASWKEWGNDFKLPIENPSKK